MEISDIGFVNRWIAFFDILGFSNLVEQAKSPLDHYRVVDLYEESLSLLDTKSAYYKESVSYTWFSDSFIIFTKDDSAMGYSCIQQLSKQFITSCLYKRIPLRGAITFGSFLSDEKKHIYIGKGLIEAYNTAECQDWIGLLITKRAIEKALGHGLDPSHHNFMNTNIPLKEGNKGSFGKNCLAYSFSNVAANFSHPVLPILEELKREAPNYAKGKYDNTIKHVQLFYKFI